MNLEQFFGFSFMVICFVAPAIALAAIVGGAVWAWLQQNGVHVEIGMPPKGG